MAIVIEFCLTNNGNFGYLIEHIKDDECVLACMFFFATGQSHTRRMNLPIWINGNLITYDANN